ncbi:hypothetical protein Dimus_009041 [Dionaea muscipula]
MDTTTDAGPKFHKPELRSLPTGTATMPDYRPDITLSAPSHDGLFFWQYMIAGSIAGCVEHMAMFPIDTLKTRMQALGSCPIKSAGVRSAFRSIIHTEGAAGFYRGIAAMALGAGPAHALYFTVYEFSKKAFSDRDLNPHLTHAAAGVCATVMSDGVFTPMDMVKQRLQLNGGGVATGAYRGVLDCVTRVAKEEGFRAFYASYRTTVIMNAPFTAVHFSTYEAAKKALLGISAQCDSGEGSIAHAAAGAAAGASAAFVTTPLDVVKTQLQCQGICGCDRYTSGSIRDVLQTIVNKDGYRGLMRGWIPRMLFHAPAAAISWATYEAGKSFFQKHIHIREESPR